MMAQALQNRPDLAKLSSYLTRVGLWHEAALAKLAETSQEEYFKLEDALHRQRSYLCISPDLQELEAVVRGLLGPSGDVHIRHLRCGRPATPALLVYLDGMIARDALQRVLQGVMFDLDSGPEPPSPDSLVEWLALNRTNVPDVSIETNLPQLIKGVLKGDAILFIQGATKAVEIAVPGFKTRPVQEPETESVIRGPREGFGETLTLNLSMVRRRIRDDRLRVETLTIGEVTSTQVSVLYLNGVCKHSLIDEVRSRLQRIKTDGIIDSAYIEEFIEDTPYTVFPQVKASERPDVVASSLLEGRFAILVDGSPFALIAPAFFVDMMQAPDDYYERFPVVFMIRLLRWIFAVIALLGPSFYVAFTTFHQEMIPTQLLLSLMASREGVPFPAVVEALLMEVTFEALREAGVRLPKMVGQTVSIVGALVIGEAAVRAGIVSAPMVIVVAITGIASFIIPKYSAGVALRLLRFPLLLLAGTFGAYGVTLGSIVIVAHLMSLRSFGAPYYAPLGPWIPEDHKDVVVRAPHWAMRKRPASVEARQDTRMAKGLRPGPHNRKGGDS